MADLIKTNGVIVEVHPKKEGSAFSLEELQEFVGGNIECISLNEKQVLVINEKGKLMDLPFNLIATEAFRLCFQPNKDIIVGNALLCTLGEEID